LDIFGEGRILVFIGGLEFAVERYELLDSCLQCARRGYDVEFPRQCQTFLQHLVGTTPWISSIVFLEDG